MVEVPSATGKAQDASFATDELKLSVYVPSDAVGKVIGKGGVIVSALKTDCKVSYISAMKPVGSSLWTSVIIIGSMTNVTSAYHAVAAIVNQEVDDVILEFAVNPKGRNSTLTFGGRSNPILRKVSAETNVRMFIPGPDSHTNRATLEGSFDQVKRAFELLLELYANPAMQKDWMNIKMASSATNQSASQSITKSARSNPTPVSAPIAIPSAAEAAVAVEKPRQETSSAPSGPKPEVKSSKPVEFQGNLLDQDDISDRNQPSSQIEKLVEIPATLVGLLLVRRPDSFSRPSRSKTNFQKSFINQIQALTDTFISRVSGPKIFVKGESNIQASVDVVAVEHDDASDIKTPAFATPNRTRLRRRSNTTGDNGEEAEEEEDASTEDIDEEDDEGSLGFESAIGELAEALSATHLEPVDGTKEGGNPVVDTVAGSVAATTTSVEPPVVFKVSGSKEAAVDLVVSHLMRIVQGDRIKDVMLDLKDKAFKLGLGKSRLQAADTNKEHLRKSVTSSKPFNRRISTSKRTSMGKSDKFKTANTAKSEK